MNSLLNKQCVLDGGAIIPRRFKSSLKIFVTVPWLYGEIHPSCLEHIAAQVCSVKTMPPYYVTPASKILDEIKEGKALQTSRNLNKYIEAFLETDATHMWMIDADTEPPPHALCELLKLDVDISSGFSFTHRTRNVTTVLKWIQNQQSKRATTPLDLRLKQATAHLDRRFLSPDEIFGKVIKTPPTKIATGTFCLLIRRRVLEKHHPRVQALRFRWKGPQHGPDFQFWLDAQALGFTVAIHGGVMCGHLPEYPLKTLEHIHR